MGRPGLFSSGTPSLGVGRMDGESMDLFEWGIMFGFCFVFVMWCICLLALVAAESMCLGSNTLMFLAYVGNS